MAYDDISLNLKRAVLTAEDSAFFDHDGLDYEELKKSMEMWKQGDFSRGGSTITQQLAKNLYLSPSRNPMRKVTELLIARRLEAALTKQRIFEIYLNMIEWGDGIFGCEAASRAYFGKSCAGLDVPEAALLAGAIINPRVHNPAKPTKRLLRRQQIILRRMQFKPPAPDAPPPLNESAPIDNPIIPQPSPFPDPPPVNKSGSGSPANPPPARSPAGDGGTGSFS